MKKQYVYLIFLNTLICFFSIYAANAKYGEMYNGSVRHWTAIAAGWFAFICPIILIFFYAAVDFNWSYRDLRKYYFPHAAILFLCIIEMAKLPMLITLMGADVLVIIGISLGVFSVIVQVICYKALFKRKFDFIESIKAIREAREVFEQRYEEVEKNEKILRIIIGCDVIIGIPAPVAAIYLCIIAVSGIVSGVYLIKLRREYLMNKLADMTDANWMMFNYYFCLGISVFAYFYELQVISLVAIVSCGFKWIMIDSRWASEYHNNNLLKHDVR